MLLINTKVFQSFDFIELALRTLVPSQEQTASQNYYSLYQIEYCKENIGKNLVDAIKIRLCSTASRTSLAAGSVTGFLSPQMPESSSQKLEAEA